jgi:hypothetical protein
MSSAQQDLVGVFHQESDAKGAPDFYLFREEARELKKLDLAYFINHGNDIRLLECVDDAARLAEENGTPVRFVNPVQSRKIVGSRLPEKTSSMERVIDTVFHDERRGTLRPFVHGRALMHSRRKKPLAVVAAESWAKTPHAIRKEKSA